MYGGSAIRTIWTVWTVYTGDPIVRKEGKQNHLTPYIVGYSIVTGGDLMGTLFEDIQQGLQEAIDYEKGIGKARTTVYVIDPVKKYTNEEIKNIRNQAGMTQAVFANYMGVSQKTVEAWELGRTHPTGPAYRLLDILAAGKESELSFVSVLS